MKSFAILLSVQFIAAVWCAVIPPSTIGDFTNMKLLRDVVGIISGSKSQSSQGLVERTGARCQLKELSACFGSASQKYYDSLVNGDKEEIRLSVCSLASQYSSCIASYKTHCSPRQRLAFDMVITGVSYLCTKEGFDNYLFLAPCLRNNQLSTQINACNLKLSNPGRNINFCSLFDNYTSCAVEAVRIACKADTEGKIRDTLTSLLSPVKEAVCQENASETINPAPQKPNSRKRREASEEMGGLLGGGFFEEPAGTQQFFPSEFSWGETQAAPNDFTGQQFSWGQNPTTSQNFGGSEFNWEFPFMTSQQGGQESEEVSTMSPDFITPELSSEEVSTFAPDVTTQESSSEEVTTASPDVTTAESSSEEVTTASPDVTTAESSSEEVTTASPDVTTAESSSEEETTATPDVTTAESSSEEETTASPDVTTPEPSSDEEAEQTTAATTLNILSTTTAGLDDTEDATPAPVQPEPIPTVAPPTTPGYHVPPFQCYECHSGAPGYWQNTMCPSNGKIKGWAALPSVCNGPCFSAVTKYPKGEVYRACSTNYYFPFKLPYDGCVRYNQELFCFCSGDFCNNRDMVADQQAYILEGLITLK